MMTTNCIKNIFLTANTFQCSEFLLLKESNTYIFSDSRCFSINKKLYKKYKDIGTCLTYFYAIINNNSLSNDLLLLITEFLFFNK